MSLPVFQLKQQIIDAVTKHNVVVIVGETGSGKSTQIPQFLQHFGPVAVTQPRRISAISLAERVSNETQTKLGTKVGYSVRFEEMSSPETEIKFMTDGMMMREMVTDKKLSKYNLVILDEAHERSVRTDVLLGLFKRNICKRDGFKLVIMSATLDSNLFANYFNAPVLNVPGRQHPIRIFHLVTPETDYVDATCRTISKIHTENEPGDILAFMTGQEDIESCADLLEHHQKNLPHLIICKLFANLPTKQQKKVFIPTPKSSAGTLRKVVLATNIAETAVTIPGLKYVIDNGLAKIKRYLPLSGIDHLNVEPISKQSSLQRAGRAGREGPGSVFRLYTEESWQNTLPEFSSPEIERVDLSAVVLLLKCIGIHDIEDFPFITSPSKDALASATRRLLLLGAIEKSSGKITKLGKQMSRFPLDPCIARVIVGAAHNSLLSYDLISMVSCLCVESLFFTPTSPSEKEKAEELRKQFISLDGDVITRINVLKAYQNNKSSDWCSRNYLNYRNLKYISKVKKQLKRLAEKNYDVSDSSSPAELLKALLYGYFTNTAYLQPDGRYLIPKGKKIVLIHPSSVLFNQKIEIVSYVQLIRNDNNRWYICGVNRVDNTWLKELVNKIST